MFNCFTKCTRVLCDGFFSFSSSSFACFNRHNIHQSDIILFTITMHQFSGTNHLIIDYRTISNSFDQPIVREINSIEILSNTFNVKSAIQWMCYDESKFCWTVTMSRSKAIALKNKFRNEMWIILLENWMMFIDSEMNWK